MTDRVILEALGHELLDHLNDQGAPALWHLIGRAGFGEDARVWILVVTNENKDDMAMQMLSHAVPFGVDICALTYGAWTVEPEQMQGFDGRPSQHPDAKHVRCVFLITRDHQAVSIFEGPDTPRRVDHEMPVAGSAFGIAMLSLFPAEEAT